MKQLSCEALESASTPQLFIVSLCSQLERNDDASGLRQLYSQLAGVGCFCVKHYQKQQKHFKRISIHGAISFNKQVATLSGYLPSSG